MTNLMTDWPTVKQVLQWILRMPCTQKVQHLTVCMTQITIHKLISHTEISYTQQLHFSHTFDSLNITKFTCRLHSNSLGDQGVKVICEPLKAMSNLQLLTWVRHNLIILPTYIWGYPITFLVPLLLFSSVHRVHPTYTHVHAWISVAHWPLS